MTRQHGPSRGQAPPGDRAEAADALRCGGLPSLIWAIPLIAALIGLSLAARSISRHGPTIMISFASAEGLEPGKTKVEYRDVVIGSVKAVTLSKDLSRVLVSVELTKGADAFVAKDTRFWIVRPRVGATRVSGLGTLLSGPYIGADAGRSPDRQTQFVGVESPPAVVGDVKGHRFTLKGDYLGSVSIGSPVLYRRVQVGRVVDFSFQMGSAGVTIHVFVKAPFDQYVGANSRWWTQAESTCGSIRRDCS